MRTSEASRSCAPCRLSKPGFAVQEGALRAPAAGALAFAGWQHARLFGEPTAEGYATANQWYQITPALALNLSQSYFADRSGRVHRGIVLPDEVVAGPERFDAPEQDPVVKRALAWLGGSQPPSSGPR